MAYPVTQKFVTAPDGTKIGYQVVGRGQKPFVLCNGLGGTIVAWSPIYNEFGDRFKFIAWDYRGLFTSDAPNHPDDMAISHHVGDLAAVLKAENITRAVFGGWSMGVQVCLEYYRKHAKNYRGIFLINGTAGSPYNTALNSSLAKYIIPNVNALLKRAMPRLQPALTPLAKRVINSRDFIRIVSRLGLIHENLNSRIFKQVAREMVKTNLTNFLHILDHLSKHDASDLLRKIKVPTLIMAGTRDLMTPAWVAEEMAREIPNAELFIINQGSHYSLLEFPKLINRRLRQFLDEHFAERGDARRAKEGPFCLKQKPTSSSSAPVSRA